MAFGLKYFGKFRSISVGIYWKIEIEERDYNGESEEILLCENPLEIIWEKQGDEFYEPIKASEATIYVKCVENFKYINLFTSEPNKYRVSIYRNTILYWQGYITPDTYSESFTHTPYDIEVKATDGYNILKNYNFVDELGNQYTGQKTVWELMTIVIDKLELTLDIADWFDLYPVNTDEKKSPLQQIYIDMSAIYSTSDSITYEDILKICLTPFAAQIFQANGAINIRRIMSLQSSVRPLSFYTVGSKFPSGWLLDSDGNNIITHDGQPIIVETKRDVIDSMWDGEMQMIGAESSLTIVPGVNKITIDQKQQLNENFATNPLNIYNPDNWITQTSSYGNSSIKVNQKQKSLSLYVSSTCSIRFSFAIEQTTKKIKLSFNSIFVPYRAIISLEASSKLYIWTGEKWVNSVDDTSYSIDLNRCRGLKYDNQYWDFISSNTAGVQENVSHEIIGIPEAGIINFVFSEIKSDVEGFFGCLWFKKFTLNFESDSSENTQVFSISNNQNEELNIDLKVSDALRQANTKYVYSLFFTYSDGKPTILWHSYGHKNYMTLLQHIINSAIIFRQAATKQIVGTMFTGKHVDLNTVVQDNNYLNTCYYVNSMQLRAKYDKIIDLELNEFPNLLQNNPEQKGDCVLCLENLSVTTAQALPSSIVIDNNGIINLYSITNNQLININKNYVHGTESIFSSQDNYLLYMEAPDTGQHNGNIIIYSGDGTIFKKFNYNDTYFLPVATDKRLLVFLLDGIYYSLYTRTILSFDPFNTLDIDTVNYPIPSTSIYLPLDNEDMYDDNKIGTAPHTLFIGPCLFDSRIASNNFAVDLSSNLKKIIAVSDYFIAGITTTAHEGREGSWVDVYTRNALDFSDMALKKTIFIDNDSVNKACLSGYLLVIATSLGNVILYDLNEDTNKTINLGGTKTVINIFFLIGNLYIVCSDCILRYNL